MTVAKKPRKPSDRAALYQGVFDGLDGRRVLLDLMRTHHMMSSTWCKDPYDSAFREGERSVILRIMKLMNVDVKKLEALVAESEKEMNELL